MSQQLIAKANTPEIAQVIAKLGTSSGVVVEMLSFFDGKIFAGNVIADKPRRENVLVHVDKLYQKRMLGAAGELEQAARITSKQIFSNTYLKALETYQKINDLHERTHVPVTDLLGAAVTGSPTVPTEYELVRKVIGMTDVAGPQYVMETFNAINAVTVKQTTDLQVLGWARSAKLTGQPEIGDEQIPDISKNVFTSYFKDIYADAFRYEFGMREKVQSQFNLESEVTNDVPGLMAKMVDDKIVAALNAIADTTPVTDWDAMSGEHYTSDAALDIENVDATLREYGGATAAFMTRATARAYRRNVGKSSLTNGGDTELMSMEKNRSFKMGYNEQVTAYVNEGIVAASVAVVSPQWGLLIRGPKIQVTYKNQFTPAQMEGTIYFDFNGFKEKVAAAGVHIVGLLS